MIVIKDVDLIARARETMYGPRDENILNKLLNEMDGLREDAAVLSVLTTNRPHSLFTRYAGLLLPSLSVQADHKQPHGQRSFSDDAGCQIVGREMVCERR
jgi:hypothetical protein